MQGTNFVIDQAADNSTVPSTLGDPRLQAQFRANVNNSEPKPAVEAPAKEEVKEPTPAPDLTMIKTGKDIAESMKI